MISFPTAINILKEEIQSGESIEVTTDESLGFILSETVFSPINMPPFNQSAMDGYALGDATSSRYKLIDEVKAGDSSDSMLLKSGEAIRIFTGGMVPKGTVTIAKQEIVNTNGEYISLSEKIKINQNIRPEGEQIEKGNLAIEKGKLIDAGVVGYLYGIGVNRVTVTKKPTVTIIATGNELTKPGEKLKLGKIYESNTYTLKAAFEEINIEAKIQTVEDNYKSTVEIIYEAINNYDLVVLTGGISVGDYDFVGKAFHELGVEEKFYKVKQKPGKPIFFGKKGKTTVFGLPGNPAAALSCFYMYVVPAIRKFQGFKKVHLEKRILNLTNDFEKSNKLSHFLKAYYNENDVEILNHQSSAMLRSFATANCIVLLEEKREHWKKGDSVEVFILP